MPVDRSGHATGTLIVGANGKLAAPVRPGKVNLADTPATLLGKNVGKGVKPITFRGQGGLIYANGQKFAIKGANWFGSEDRNGPMQGLDEHVTAAAQKAAEKAGEEGKKRRRRRKYKRKLDGDDGDDGGDDGGGGGGNDGDSDTADEAEDDAGGGERRANASETELVSAVDRIFAPKGRREL